MNNSPIYVVLANANLFFSRDSTRDTVCLRNSEIELRVSLFNTANRQKSFVYCGPHLWNSLESELKKAPSKIDIKVDV